VVIEIGAGALLLVGFRTRLMAWVLAAFTVAAALVFHRALGDPNQFVHFMKNLAIAGGLVHIAGAGASAFSLDGYSFEGRRSPA
jgi:putative oxidoreductase